MARGIKTGGRRKGTQNKRTLEEKQLALREINRAVDILAKDKLKNLIPEVKELIGVVKGIISQFQKVAYSQAPGAAGFSAAAWDQLKSWMEFYAHVLHEAAYIEHKAADYQSPKFRAIMVSAPPGDGLRPATPKTINHVGDANAAARTYLQVVKGGKAG